MSGAWAAFCDVLWHRAKCSRHLPLQLADAISIKILIIVVAFVAWFDFYCFQLILQNFPYGRDGNLASKSLKIQMKTKQTPRHSRFRVISPPYVSLNSGHISQNTSGLDRTWVRN